MLADPPKSFGLTALTWPFELELEAHKQGWIDRFLFQSDYQRQSLLRHLEPLNRVRELKGYRPFFNLASPSHEIRFDPEGPSDYFGVGRLSRDDGGKYAEDTWMTLAKVCAPQPIKAFMLGFGDNAKEKCGGRAPCNWLDWMTWTPGTITAAELFSRIHLLIHRTGGSKENWPRVVLEAWSAGVVVIVDNDYGVAEMVTDGVNGFCVDSSDEASFRASQLAFDDSLRRKMADADLASEQQTRLSANRSPSSLPDDSPTSSSPRRLRLWCAMCAQSKCHG